MSARALEHFERTGLLPANGAFIEDVDVRPSLTERLAALEGYRAWWSKVAPRTCTPGSVFVELAKGGIVEDRELTEPVKRVLVVVEGWDCAQDRFVFSSVPLK